MHSRRTLSALGITGAIALAATGCSAQVDSPTDGVSVVTTTTQVADITRNVAGDAVALTQLLNPGASAHSYDPTPAALQALAGADVLIVNGAGLEQWLDPVIASSGFDGQVVDASEGVDLIPIADGDHDHGDHGDDHDHGAYDPHVWTDPASAIAMTETIAIALEAADPADADRFRANADAYIEQLEQLQTWMGEAYGQVPEADRLLVTNHDTFRYLARAYDITIVGSVLPSFDDSAEISAAAIDRLVADIRATGARAVFSEAQLSPAVAATIADEAGVRVYSGEEALFTDSLGLPGSRGETYIGSQIHNTSIMVEAWGASPPEPPKDLR